MSHRIAQERHIQISRDEHRKKEEDRGEKKEGLDESSLGKIFDIDKDCENKDSCET